MNKKKKLISLLVFAFLLVIINSSLISARIFDTNSPSMKLLLEEVTPEPVEPGQDVTVKIRIINEGGELADNVFVDLNIEYPFYLKTRSGIPEKIKSLCVGCSLDNTYYLIVDANAKSGLYSLNFEVFYDDTTKRFGETIDIKVIGKPDMLLQTENIESNISPGEKFYLNFNLKNIGTGIARNIKIIPESDKIFMLGSNINLVKEVLPGKESAFNMEFIVKESLVPDTYKFPVTLKYTDEKGNSYTESAEIGINILHKADISIQSIKINPAIPTTSDHVRMAGIIENTGKGDADKVTIELVTKDRRYQAFAGQLKAGEDTPFYFDTKPEKSGVNTVTLKISYYDDFGYQEIETPLQKEVLKPKNNVWVIAIIVVIVMVIGYLLYINRKAEK